MFSQFENQKSIIMERELPFHKIMLWHAGCSECTGKAIMIGPRIKSNIYLRKDRLACFCFFTQGAKNLTSH